MWEINFEDGSVLTFATEAEMKAYEQARWGSTETCPDCGAEPTGTEYGPVCACYIV